MRSAVFVTGSREWRNKRVVFEALDLHLERSRAAYGGEGVLILAHGQARGVDAIADEWAAGKRDVVEIPVPCFDWLGRRGGPERNRVLAHLARALWEQGVDPVAFEAFSLGSSGTEDMIARARAAGFEVNVHEAQENLFR